MSKLKLVGYAALIVQAWAVFAVCGDALAAEPGDIVRDPAFNELVRQHNRIARNQEKYFDSLTDKELAAATKRVGGAEGFRKLVNSVYDPKKGTNRRAMRDVLRETGGNEKEYATLAAMVQKLVEKYPELAGKRRTSYVADIVESMRDEKLSMCLYCTETGVRPIDPDYDADPCQEACHDALVERNESITEAYLVGLVACAAPNVIPGLGQVASIGCYLSEHAAVMYAYLDARNDYLQCRRECLVDADYGECDSHSDCQQGEYCHLVEGPLMNPVLIPSCYIKKPEGERCDLSIECTTGCCRTFWFRKVCRPADRCS